MHQFRGGDIDQAVSPGPQDDCLRKRMTEAGINPAHIGQAHFIERIRSNTAHYDDVIRRMGIKFEPCYFEYFESGVQGGQANAGSAGKKYCPPPRLMRAPALIWVAFLPETPDPFVQPSYFHRIRWMPG